MSEKTDLKSSVGVLGYRGPAVIGDPPPGAEYASALRPGTVIVNERHGTARRLSRRIAVWAGTLGLLAFVGFYAAVILDVIGFLTSLLFAAIFALVALVAMCGAVFGVIGLWQEQNQRAGALTSVAVNSLIVLVAGALFLLLW